MLPIYNDLIANGYRVILYSGDLDRFEFLFFSKKNLIFVSFNFYLFIFFFSSCVNYIGTQTFASTITASGKAIDWHPWFAQTGIVAGYSFSVGNLTFATVLNAGKLFDQWNTKFLYVIHDFDFLFFQDTWCLNIRKFPLFTYLAISSVDNHFKKVFFSIFQINFIASCNRNNIHGCIDLLSRL